MTTTVDRLGGWLLERTTRRSFLARTTMGATALSVAPLSYALRPVSAYAAVCECNGSGCGCGEACCDGYTQFCCTIDGGVNACPPGTFPGGWWQASGSAYCNGLRYYIDCHGECHGCDCSGGGHFCPGCDGLTCECANGSCANRHVGCTEFRYGQCHTEIACAGRISCRVVSCTPPWQLDSTCSHVAQTDNSTANHYAACQNGPTTFRASMVAIAVPPGGAGYWLVDTAGVVHAFGGVVNHGDLTGVHLSQPIVGMASTVTGEGYWLVARDGGVFAFGDAAFDGSAGGIHLSQPVVGMAVDQAGSSGYWLVARDGGIFTYGDASFDGSTGSMHLNKPIVAMAAPSSGSGYWLVAADGGVFAFGAAAFDGSTGSLQLRSPVVGAAATPSGDGYWLVAADGGIFAFGDAGFFGSMGGTALKAPIVAMAASASGKGYWLAAADGGVFCFGDAAFYGAATG